MVLPQGAGRNLATEWTRPTTIHAARGTAGRAAKIAHRHFVLEALNGLATAYYSYYIFFFMERRFGFSKADNLLLTTFYGFTYMISAASAGQLAHRLGRFRLLRLGFGGMMFAMLLGAAAPALMGYSRPAMFLEFVVLIVWTISASTSWPTLQALLSSEGSGELPRIAGIYNLIWAGTSGVAFLSAGALFDFSNVGTTFLLPAVIHAVELVLLGRLEKRAATIVPVNPTAPGQIEAAAPTNPRAKAFVRLAWIANPFAYVAMYGLCPLSRNCPCASA